MENGRPPEFNISIVDRISDIDRAVWNKLAASNQTLQPFISWDFLDALETTGCVSPETGWGPRHLMARNAQDKIVGAAPLYVKSHSRGEFVFDYAWADAFERAGGSYYPKLLCASPFTPVTGPRLLTDPAEPQALTRLSSAMRQMAEKANLSSVHINFLDPPSWQTLGQTGWLQRTDQQFHWHNRDYKSFDDFLAALSSRKRKMIRKERRAAQEGIAIRKLTGGDIKANHWDAFFKFYLDTGSRKWGSPYLNRAFFEELHARLADQILLVLAFDNDQPIAGALNLFDQEAIYGRYWGRGVERSFLHFEICYYQAMDFAIDKQLKRVEAGAQGEHKLARGYETTQTRSAHWICHDGFRDAVEKYLQHERVAVADDMEMLAAAAPFRKTNLPNGTITESDEESF